MYYRQASHSIFEMNNWKQNFRDKFIRDHFLESFTMNQQKNSPVSNNSSQYLNNSVNNGSLPLFLEGMLDEQSQSKATVNHIQGTLNAGVSSIFGAMFVGGSLEKMGPLYKVLCSVIISALLQLAEFRFDDSDFLAKLSQISDEFIEFKPFAHRTTVQKMLSGHSYESTDDWLEKSLQLVIDRADKLGFKPPKISSNLDPHFIDRKPLHRNQEIKRVMIGGKYTLKTRYQFDVANMSPFGFITACDHVSKRLKDNSDLGNLSFASTFGKAFTSMEKAGLHLTNLNGDRGLNNAGMHAISKNNLWPDALGAVGTFGEFTTDAFLTTPWMAKKESKADLLLAQDLDNMMIKTMTFSKKQYMGDQELVKSLADLSKNKKIEEIGRAHV